MLKKGPMEAPLTNQKAAGGGKMVPAKTYKDRKDIGTQRKTSDRQQQPTQARGSAATHAPTEVP